MTSRAEQAKIDGKKRRREIANAAARVFNRIGFTNATMSQVAESAGMAKASLYHYFDSKGAILAYLHTAFMGLLLEKTRARLDVGAKGMDVVRGIVLDILELMDTHPGHVRVFVEHFGELPQDDMASHIAKRGEYQQMLVSALEEAVSSGEIRKVDPGLTSLAIFGMCNWAYQWYRPRGRYEPKQIANHFTALIEHGLQLPVAVEAPWHSAS